MAPKLERFVSPGKGNGLRAKAAVRRGDVLAEAEPLACCVSTRESARVCHHCFTRRETLSRCSSCKSARYCNVTCQKRAWPRHKRECRCLRGLLPRVPTDAVRLTARLVFALSSPGESRPEDLYSVEEHLSHLASMSQQKRDGLSLLASMLQLYLQPEEGDLSALPPPCQDPLDLIAKVTCNCFTISDEELREVGVGLYPSFSLLNHDCRPNCVLMFEGPRAQLRAVRDVRPGEELTISYIETLLDSEGRQKQLQEQFHFSCSCCRCRSRDTDELLLSGAESSWSCLREELLSLEELKTQSDWSALRSGCRSLLAHASADVPEENMFKLRVTDLALDAAVQLQLWEEAAALGERTLPVYRKYFPDPHPVLGLQLMRVAKLQHHLGLVQKALGTFSQAQQVIRVTHGSERPLAADLLTRMEECRCELERRAVTD
ncbi:histone-lysine N-methyltransferase SMYD3 [Neosynchiropus ocellatus]